MAAGTSEYKAFIRGATTRLDARSPVDTGDSRDFVVNNVNHLRDSSCQCLVNLTGRVAGKASWDGVGSGADFSRIVDLPVMPLVLKTMPDDNSSRLVIRLDAQITVAGTATWRFALKAIGTYDSSPPPAASLGFANVCELSTTSTSVVELGPASIYASARPDLPSWRDVPARDGSAELGSATVFMAQLEVWAKSTSAGIPRFHALTVHEWVAV